MNLLKSKNEALAELLMQEGALTGHEIADRTRKQSIFDPAVFWETYKNFNHYRPLRLNDKYKHAMMNCLASQRGTGALLGIDILSRLKEKFDVLSGNNTQKESDEDMKANEIGRFLGYKYPEGNCDEMVRKYIRKK
ncbi:MAG: hypothetical protein OSJ76_01940 [Alphaproteobacteria bacterium]|nr:hypothetical protein [Alphaproteobacteria bacterium]